MENTLGINNAKLSKKKLLQFLWKFKNEYQTVHYLMQSANLNAHFEKSA